MFPVENPEEHREIHTHSLGGRLSFLFLLQRGSQLGGGGPPPLISTLHLAEAGKSQCSRAAKVYRASSRTAKDTQRNAISKQTNKETNKQKTNQKKKKRQQKTKTTTANHQKSTSYGLETAYFVFCELILHETAGISL